MGKQKRGVCIESHDKQRHRDDHTVFYILMRTKNISRARTSWAWSPNPGVLVPKRLDKLSWVVTMGWSVL